MAREKTKDEEEVRTTLRFPKSHKEKAESAAHVDRRSLNFWIAEAVRMRLEAEGLIPPAERKLSRR